MGKGRREDEGVKKRQRTPRSMYGEEKKSGGKKRTIVG